MLLAGDKLERNYTIKKKSFEVTFSVILPADTHIYICTKNQEEYVLITILSINIFRQLYTILIRITNYHQNE